MTNPPEQHADKKQFKTVLRLPPELADEIKGAAKTNGRSLNNEIIARLQESPLEAVMDRLDRMERMMRLVIDRG